MKELEAIPVSSPASVNVFRRILTHGPVGRVDIARAEGLSQSAVTKAVGPLIEAGFVVEDELVRTEPGVGRPINPLRVSASRAYVAGVKVTAGHSYGVLSDLGGAVLATVHRANPSASVDDVVGTIQQIHSALLEQSPHQGITAVGVSVSGDVDRVHGVVRESPLLGWKDVPLREQLETLLDIPVIVDNDVRALTVAEQLFGHGRDSASFAVVTLGEGVGCGIFLNGAVVDGAHGISGEIGHLPLAPNDLVCSCGRRGCVETIASTYAILRRARTALDRPHLSVNELFDLAHDGNEHATQAFADAGEIVGSALAILANIVGPECVIIAGEGVTEYELYADKLKEAFAAHVFGAAADLEMILMAHTFDDWARGAAVSVIDAIAAG